MYYLGSGSLERLKGLHPSAIVVVATAIIWTEQDFTVLETVRTKQKQKEYVANGASWTMKSWHLKQKDGYSHAVDLGAWLDDELSWHEGLYPAIADAMFEAAAHHNVYVEWGASKKLDPRGSFNNSNDMPHWQFPRL